ncbi:MAG: hypothetical protein M1839_009095 [Geoglossum umbratile]|nr:MAG: hypothetical protein M1839_009095 [Geoglossum umbratile]
MSPPPPPDPAIELSLLRYYPSQPAADHIARFEKLVSLAYPNASESRKWNLFTKTLNPPNFHSPPSVASSTTSGAPPERSHHRRQASYAAESEESPMRWLQQVQRSQDIPFERVKELFVDRWTAPEEREPRLKTEKSGKRRSKSQPPPGWGAGSKTSSVISVDSTKARLGYEPSVRDNDSTITTATTIVPSRSVISNRSHSGYRHEANGSESLKIGLSVLEREGAGNRVVLHFPDQKPRKRRGTVSRRSSPPLPTSHPPLPSRPASTPFASSPFTPPPPPPPRMASPPKRYSTPPLRAVQDISYVSRRGDGKVVVPTVRPIAIRPPAIKVPPRPTIEEVEDISELDLKASRSTIGLPKAFNAILEAVTPRGLPPSGIANGFQIGAVGEACREVSGENSTGEDLAEEGRERRRAEAERKRIADEEKAREEEEEKEERLEEERLEAEKLREERLREERLREERLREEEIREERLREERLREEKARAERLCEERLREERLREKRIREERLREERLREERLREERIRQERIREEKLREERRKEQKLREEQLKLERLREEVKRMKEQKERERQEKLRLEREMREKEERVKQERMEEEKRERERVEQERVERERLKEEQLSEDVSPEGSPKESPRSPPSSPPLAPRTTNPPHLPLTSKTLLITNTNTPLGHQVALTLASLGANIVAHYFHTTPSDPSIISLITQIRSLAKSGAGGVSIVYGDLGDGGRTAEGVVRRAVDGWGGIDGAIWCPPQAAQGAEDGGGGFLGWTPKADTTAGLVPFVQATIRRMILQYHAVPTDPRPPPHQMPDFPVVCISPQPPPLSPSSSFPALHARAALSSIVQACAWEFAGYGIRVNSIAVDSPAAAADDDLLDVLEWLVGPRSRRVTGVEIPVAGAGRPTAARRPAWW